LRSGGFILRDAARAVRRAPAHAVMVASVLAIGITAAPLTFSVVDAVLLKPLPIEDGDRLVFISSFDAEGTEGADRRRGAVQSEARYVIGHRPVDRRVSPHVHDVGRLPASAPLDRRRSLRTAEEEARGETDVAVLGYRFWRRDLGGRTDVLNLTVTRDPRRYPVAPGQKDPYILSFDEATRRITMMRRFNAGLMSAFGLLGVLIGAAGIYAVTGSVSPSRPTRSACGWRSARRSTSHARYSPPRLATSARTGAGPADGVAAVARLRQPAVRRHAGGSMGLCRGVGNGLRGGLVSLRA
jgi:hypothetical protein